MILQSVRWYLTYFLSYQDIEELIKNVAFLLITALYNRWAPHYSPQLEAAFRLNKKRVGTRWRMNETYTKLKGEWTYYHRAIDKQGQAIDFLLTAKRDTKVALHFLKKAVNEKDKPNLVNIDQSGANKAGLKQLNQDHNKRVKIHQCKYLNKIIEQDHRRIKRLKKLMLSFKKFHTVQWTLAGIEVMAMVKKGQIKTSVFEATSPAERFYALAA